MLSFAKLTGCIPGLTICTCNPGLSGFACYSRTFQLSFFPAEAGFPGRSGIQAPMRISRRLWHQFQIIPGRSPSFSEAL
jgi:hydroxyacyl-ACP dehydratase HTD2-like protein with hotdog domain